MFKKVLAVLLGLVLLSGLFFGYKIITADKVLNVEYTTHINADLKSAYAQAYDLANWKNWSAWHKMDPEMEMNFSPVTSGKGAKYSWDSANNNVGKGAMEITGAELYKSITYLLDFGEQGTATSAMYFEEAGEETKVTWTMKSNEEASKAQNALFEMLIKNSYKKGLLNMDKEAQKHKVEGALSRVTDVEEVELEERYFLGLPYSTTTDEAALQQAYSEGFPKVMAYLTSRNITPASMPTSYWVNWDEPNQKAEMIVGMFVPSKMRAGAGMVLQTVPAGKYLKATHFGDYVHEDKAHYALAGYAQEKGLEIGMPISVYANDPTLVAPEEVATEVWYPVLG